MKKLKKIYEYFTDGIWKVRYSDLPKKQRYLLLPGRVLLLTIRGYSRNKCTLRASSLTYFTLLSVVPIFALAFGIAKSFNLQKILEEQLAGALKGNEEVLNRILEFSRNQLQATQGKVIAGIGVILLFWTIVKLLSNVESAFNDIWGVKNQRSFPRKIADYLILVAVTPFFIGISGSVTAFLSSQPEVLMQKYEFFAYFGPLFLVWVKFLPLIILVPYFTFLYVFLPNTTIKIRAAIMGGTFAAFALINMQSLYIWAQVSLFTKYSAIYGSFASFPMFLIWLEISWMILLLGAEISFATQNIETFEFEKESEFASNDQINLMAVYITSVLTERFENEQPPLSTSEIMQKLKLPHKMAERVLFLLKKAKIIEPVKLDNDSTNRDEAYRPAIPPRKLTVHYIIKKLNNLGEKYDHNTKDKKLEKIEESIAKMHKLCEKSEFNISLKKL